MSNWTRVILATSSLENKGSEDGPKFYPAIDAINSWLSKHSNCLLFQVQNPDDTANSPDDLFVAYCKGLSWSGFTEAVSAAPWEWKEQVQLFLEQEDDLGFQKLELTR